MLIDLPKFFKKINKGVITMFDIPKNFFDNRTKGMVFTEEERKLLYTLYIMELDKYEGCSKWVMEDAFNKALNELRKGK